MLQTVQIPRLCSAVYCTVPMNNHWSASVKVVQTRDAVTMLFSCWSTVIVSTSRFCWVVPLWASFCRDIDISFLSRYCHDSAESDVKHHSLATKWLFAWLAIVTQYKMRMCLGQRMGVCVCKWDGVYILWGSWKCPNPPLCPQLHIVYPLRGINPLTSRPGCMPGSRYTGVGVLFFVIWSWNC